MSPASSMATPCVSPHLMCAGNSPQLWKHSYVCSPLPMTVFLDPALSSALRIVGPTALASAAAAPAAPADLINVRREGLPASPRLAFDSGMVAGPVREGIDGCKSIAPVGHSTAEPAIDQSAPRRLV